MKHCFDVCVFTACPNNALVRATGGVVSATKPLLGHKLCLHLRRILNLALFCALVPNQISGMDGVVHPLAFGSKHGRFRHPRAGENDLDLGRPRHMKRSVLVARGGLPGQMEMVAFRCPARRKMVTIGHPGQTNMVFLAPFWPFWKTSGFGRPGQADVVGFGRPGPWAPWAEEYGPFRPPWADENHRPRPPRSYETGGLQPPSGQQK